MNPRRVVVTRSALLGGGVAALVVCLLAVLHFGWSGRWGAAAFFALPWLLVVAFSLAPPGPPRPGNDVRVVDGRPRED